jgi:hypothetical protein
MRRKRVPLPISVQDLYNVNPPLPLLYEGRAIGRTLGRKEARDEGRKGYTK